MNDEDEDFTPWTAAGAARVHEAAETLIDAIRIHTAAVTSVTSDAGDSEIIAAGCGLIPEVLAYVDAQFDYTGTGFPLGAVYQFAEEDDGADVNDEGPVSGISVLRRQDYVVTDKEAVIAAGREAYRDVSGENDPEAAAADVTHLGTALYQIGHAHGWDGLKHAPGLEPSSGVVLVLSSADVLRGDPNEWVDDDLFDHDDERLLFRQDDVYAD